jgi:hypothetical protein
VVYEQRSERRRLQREKQLLKTPQGAFPEEAEALPAERVRL